MSSWFSGGGANFSTGGGANFSTNMNHCSTFSQQSPISMEIQSPNLIGKRSLVDFGEQQDQLGLGFHHRNVKSRPSPTVDFSPVPSSDTGSGSELSYEKRMIRELEKALFEDEDEGEAVSSVTNHDFFVAPTQTQTRTQIPVSPSPSSSSSSCYSTSASPPILPPKESLIEAAVAISEGNLQFAEEIMSRLQKIANLRGTSEQRITAYMISALQSRITSSKLSSMEIYSNEHKISTQLLYDYSPCFRLAFMAANLAILETASKHGCLKIHILDFDIGQGRQYIHLLHAMARRATTTTTALKITTIPDFSSYNGEKLRSIVEVLKQLASKLNISFNFSVKNLKIRDLSIEKLGISPDETLAVNLAFKLHKLQDESVTVFNIRDELLRRVKQLSPKVVTVVEQDLNINTAPLFVRVRETFDYYGQLMESLEATLAGDCADRVKIESAIARKMANSVACEGTDRVERCEVFGKWRARMCMAGFEPVSMSEHVVEPLRLKLNNGTRGNPGFTVNWEFGGIWFGWMGRNLTFASAWI